MWKNEVQAGDIGENPQEWEIEPIELPAPVEEPIPA